MEALSNRIILIARGGGKTTMFRNYLAFIGSKSVIYKDGNRLGKAKKERIISRYMEDIFHVWI